MCHQMCQVTSKTLKSWGKYFLQSEGDTDQTSETVYFENKNDLPFYNLKRTHH